MNVFDCTQNENKGIKRPCKGERENIILRDETFKDTPQHNPYDITKHAKK